MESGQPKASFDEPYCHTQVGPWGMLLAVIGLIMAVTLGFTYHDPIARWVLSGVMAIMWFLAPCFHNLTIKEDGDRLTARFGPLSFFSTEIKFADVKDAEAGRTWFIEGWGIHQIVPSRGLVWNIWGRDCVVIRHRRLIRLGTNEPDKLLALIQARRAEVVDSPR